MGLLHEAMSRLRSICTDTLGEDTGRAAANVHPSLRYYTCVRGKLKAHTSRLFAFLMAVDGELVTWHCEGEMLVARPKGRFAGG
jgi:hypothetical protein